MARKIKNKNMKWWAWVCALSLLAVSILSACQGPAAPAAERVITIGVSSALTGPVAAGQLVLMEGYLDAVDIINRAGGVRGIRVEALWADNKYETATALSIYKRWAGEGILFYVTSSSAALEALNVIGKEYNVPCTYICGSVPTRENPGYAYFAGPTFGDWTAGLVDWWVEHEWDKPTLPKVALICPDIAFSRAVEEAFPYLESKGIEVVYKNYVSMVAVDLTVPLLAADKAGADIIIDNGLAEVSTMVRDMKRLGLDKKGMKVMVPWLTYQGGAWPELRTEAEGIVWGTLPFVTAEIEGEQGLPYIPKLVDFQMRKYGETRLTNMYYVGLHDVILGCEAVGNAIDEVGFENVDGRAVAEQLEKMDASAECFFGILPDLKATPGKRGMMSEMIPVVIRGGKITAMDGWVKVPNLFDWKKAHPEFYK